MGYDVFAAGRYVCAATIDDNIGPRYDLLALPDELGLKCPQLETLSQRFYATTTVRHAEGRVEALREELARLREAYRARRGPELLTERSVTARDEQARREIAEALLDEDPVCRALDEFCRLCDEALASGTDVCCVGD